MRILEKNEEEKIKLLYLSGLGIRVINKETGISEKLISNFLKKENLTRSPKLSGVELEDIKLKVKNMYEKGLSIDEIANIMNLNRTTISSYIKSFGLKLATRMELSNKKIGDYKQQIKELYEQGYNSYEIGEKLNKSYKTILHHLKKMEVERRSTKKIDDEKFKEMWDNGATDDEFMKEFDIARATIRGYRIKHDCHVIQWFSQTEQSLSEEQEQMILGSLLGDMSIRSTSDDSSAGLALVHCEAQKELFMKKVEILGDFMGSYHYSIPKLDSRTGKIYPGYRGHSKSHPIFKEIYNLLYPNNRKTITKEYLDKIYHPIAIAYWFMDDGSRNGTFATNSFSKEECELLQDFLLKKFNIYTSLHKQNCNYVIYILSKSRKEFDDIIRKYVVDCMRYKLRYL